MRKRRIFIGLLEVAGYFGRLTIALNAIGMRADYFGLYDSDLYRWRGNAPEGLPLESLVRMSYAGVQGAPAGSVRELRRLLFRGVLILFFLVCLVRYDSFIFSAGASFFSGIELWILRLLGKKIVFIYLGSESRPPYLNGVFLSAPQWRGYTHLLNGSKKVAARVKRQERVAHAIISHRESSQFLTRPFYDYLSVGYPKELPAIPRVAPSRGAVIRIVHAPSLPGIKGTRRIREIVRKYSLDRQLEFIELMGKKNSEVLEALRSCDFVFDEIYSDTPLGGLGAEAASFGKPTLASGYAHHGVESGSGRHPYWPPSEYCKPEDLERCFLRLVVDGEYRRKLGVSARRFIETAWSPPAVARRVVAIISGHGRAPGLVRPADVRYIHGYGISEEALRHRLGEFIRRFGIECLSLSHNPALRNSICSFAGVSGEEA